MRTRTTAIGIDGIASNTGSGYRVVSRGRGAEGGGGSNTGSGYAATSKSAGWECVGADPDGWVRVHDTGLLRKHRGDSETV